MMKMTYALALELALSALSNDQSVPYVYTTFKVVDGERQQVTERVEVPMTEVKEKLVALSESLAKKASAEKKPTTKQKEAKAEAEQVYAELKEAAKAMTVSEMIAELPSCEGKSNQKVSAYMRDLIAQQKVKRDVQKRTAYFKAI